MSGMDVTLTGKLQNNITVYIKSVYISLDTVPDDETQLRQLWNQQYGKTKPPKTVN